MSAGWPGSAITQPKSTESYATGTSHGRRQCRRAGRTKSRRHHQKLRHRQSRRRQTMSAGWPEEAIILMAIIEPSSVPVTLPASVTGASRVGGLVGRASGRIIHGRDSGHVHHLQKLCRRRSLRDRRLHWRAGGIWTKTKLHAGLQQLLEHSTPPTTGVGGGDLVLQDAGKTPAELQAPTGKHRHLRQMEHQELGLRHVQPVPGPEGRPQTATARQRRLSSAGKTAGRLRQRHRCPAHAGHQLGDFRRRLPDRGLERPVKQRHRDNRLRPAPHPHQRRRNRGRQLGP